jgi:hypothetical protein
MTSPVVVAATATGSGSEPDDTRHKISSSGRRWPNIRSKNGLTLGHFFLCLTFGIAKFGLTFGHFWPYVRPYSA